MADQEEVALPQMDDSELFKAAVSDEAPAEQASRDRDEKGRFVAKLETPPEAKAEPEKVTQPAQQEVPQAEAQPQAAEAKDEAQVPSWRLREVREAREAAERRAEQEAQQRYQLQTELQTMREELRKLQAPKQEPVDFFADPDKALQQHLSPFEQRLETFMRDMTLRTSRTAAIAQHGADKVAEMETAVAKAMQSNHPDMQTLAQQMRSSDDPAGVAMTWYQRHQLVEQTGGDINAFKAKVLEDAMKDPAFQAKVVELIKGTSGQPGKPAPVVNLPPSLNRVPSAGQSNSPDDNDSSDRGLFKYAMGR